MVCSNSEDDLFPRNNLLRHVSYSMIFVYPRLLYFSLLPLLIEPIHAASPLLNIFCELVKSNLLKILIVFRFLDN
jgi:hypothetical protein